MARILPLGFQLHKMKNKAEQVVVDRLMQRLSDDWLIFVNVLFQTDGFDAEADAILLHPVYGIGLIEVKGGEIGLKGGKWVGTDRDPVSQLRSNSYKLQRILAAETGNRHLQVHSAICLPNIGRIKGRIPAGITSEQLILAPGLDDLRATIDDVFCTPYRSPKLSAQECQTIIDFLAPTAEFVYEPELVSNYIRRELDAICDAQVDTLSCLDVHNRVFVSGRAGTGKTYLATKWTQAGLYSDVDEPPKRVLLTCYNDPLAQKLNAQFANVISDDEFAPTLVVGAFLRTVLTLEGMPKLKIREDDPSFWMDELPAHLLKNWHLVTQRFDRIIIDEAQDFSPAWIGMLESLLDPEGEGKFFLLADTHQEVVSRGFVPPAISAGWVHGELRQNVRNSRDIALVARRFLDGSAAPASLPSSEAFVGIASSRSSDVVANVKTCLDWLQHDDIHPKDILVVAGDTAIRDLLREELRLVKVGDSRQHMVACETAHRAKGLEYDAVIVAVSPKGISDTNFYVAVTRAVNRLYVVAPEEVLKKVNLA